MQQTDLRSDTFSIIMLTSFLDEPNSIQETKKVESQHAPCVFEKV